MRNSFSHLVTPMLNPSAPSTVVSSFSVEFEAARSTRLIDAIVEVRTLYDAAAMEGCKRRRICRSEVSGVAVSQVIEIGPSNSVG